MASQEEMWNLAGLLGGLHSFSGRSGPQPGMAKTMFAMGQQARADAQRKQRQEQVQTLLGQAPKIETMPQAGPMRPGEARPELTAVTQGTGYLGGQMAPTEFYGGLLSVPGMEEVGAQGLLQSMQPQQASWKLAEVGTEDGRMQRVAFNEANPSQMMPLGAAYEPRAATQISLNQGGPSTPGWKKVDEGFAQEYIDWTASGGFSDVQKNLAQLDRAIGSLTSGASTTGPGRGVVPDVVKSFTDPASLATKQQVEEVVQRNLRLILGAQFTQQEGDRLIARAFDENLPPEENTRRITLLRNQILDAARAKQDAVRYFSENGTLQGFQGKTYSKADFDADTFFKDETKTQPKRMRFNPATGKLEPVNG